MYFPTHDGVDHINIYSKGETWLGRSLSNFAHTPFKLYTYGEFASVEALWYYAKTGFKHEHLRELHGVQAKREGKELEVVQFDFFNALIAEGIKAKLRQNKDILCHLIDSGNIPLTHYYYFGEKSQPKITRLPQYDWITQVVRDVRTKCQRAGYRPNN